MTLSDLRDQGTSYTMQDLDRFDCEQFEMVAGDLLYMPKGIIHVALTSNIQQSAHLTVGLNHDGLAWKDLFLQLISTYLETMDLPVSFTGMFKDEFSHRLLSTLGKLSETVAGVEFLSMPPYWNSESLMTGGQHYCKRHSSDHALGAHRLQNSWAQPVNFQEGATGMESWAQQVVHSKSFNMQYQKLVSLLEQSLQQCTSFPTRGYQRASAVRNVNEDLIRHLRRAATTDEVPTVLMSLFLEHDR